MDSSLQMTCFREAGNHFCPAVAMIPIPRGFIRDETSLRPALKVHRQLSEW